MVRQPILLRLDRHRISKKPIHLFQLPSLRLGVKYVYDRHASQVDGHEEEIDAGADASNADGPHLGDDDGSDGAPGRGKVEAARAQGRGEDLGTVDPRGWPEAEAVAERVDEDEDDAGVVGRVVRVVRVREGERAVDLWERTT